MLTINASKADELAHWQEFLATLPEGCYLDLYLRGSSDMLKQAMADDMCCEPISALRRERTIALEDLNEANKALRLAKEELRSVQQQVAVQRREAVRIREELSEAAKAATTLARQADDAHRRAVSAVIARVG